MFRITLGVVIRVAQGVAVNAWPGVDGTSTRTRGLGEY